MNLDINNKQHKITTALLMAAGMGTRIRPISATIPKPLIPVNGTPMIETLIQAILSAGIQNIIITVGYKKEEYFYLKDKYKNITFVENIDYEKRNTISSFFAAMDFLLNENCIICESDLYVFDPSIIKGEMDKSRYLMRSVSLQNNEWGFNLENNRVQKIVRPNPKIYLDHHMYGIAYWLSKDLEKLRYIVSKCYYDLGNEQKAYDEIANEIFHEIDMGVIKIKDNQLFEIDSLEDLIQIDPSYNAYFNK